MSTFVRPSWTGFGRAALLGLMFALGGGASEASAQSTADKYQQQRDRVENTPRARFSLHAEPTMVLNANQFQCGLVNSGDTCTDVFDSPTGAGGFWPTGSPNAYMFNSGIMIAGIIPENAGFEWAGDTTGAYFFDALGTQQHGTPITNIYNSLDPADIAAWPGEGSIPDFPFATAFITDTEIFSDVLIGRAFGSQQDTWVMYWDGDPGLSANRDHPMGMTIEQRTMAWNFPAGNEATIYIFYKITNVTNNAEFQSLNEQNFGIALPDGGWSYDSLYIAYGADPDVTADATENFASVILPFNMGITYHATFTADEFSYPPSLFYPPFFTQAPGIVGVQYLKSPVDPATGDEVGLTMFSVHENPGSCNGLCDPTGDKQLWRYISGNVNPGLGDPSCSFPDPQESRICYLPQQPADARFFQASGPFSLAPGQSTTIVVSMMAAATVNTSEITLGSENPPGIPGLRPGCGDEILPIEIAAGWASTPIALCTDQPDGPLDLRDILVVPNSLLGRAQVAQAVFDGQFLLPFAPEPPTFYLVPGDDVVSIVWEPSPTETMNIDENGDTIGGDPFYNIASQEFNPETGDANPLYNPNYRQFDVEGYRIYRSTDNANFELIAQYDYAGTEFTDYRCEADRTFVPGEDDEDDCAEEHIAINDLTDIDDDFVIDPFVLFGGPNAQRLRLADGRTLAIRGDSATAGETPDLTDTGMPFVHVDETVRNGFRYFYQVRAFDINSTFSGLISLESSSETKSVIPRASQIDPATALFSVALLGTDGSEIVMGDAEINPVTGTFEGPMPAAPAIEVDFLPFAPDLLSTGVYELTIDSVVPQYLYDGRYYLTGPDGESIVLFNGELTPSTQSGVPEFIVEELGPFAILADSTLAAAQAANGGEPPPTAGIFTVEITVGNQEFNSRDADWAYDQPQFFGSPDPDTTAHIGGSRWFDTSDEVMADPTVGYLHGQLAGITTIFQPVPYQTSSTNNNPGPGLAAYTDPDPTPPNNGDAIGGDIFRRFLQVTMSAQRQADMQIHWGAGGTVDSVVDVTHHVDVPYSTHVRASYGFLTDGDAAPPQINANQAGVLTYADFYYIPGLEQCVAPNCPTGGIGNLATDYPAPLSEDPVVMPVDVTGDRVADGTGFGLYIASHPFLFLGTPPAEGTVWTLRTYAGEVTGTPGAYSFSQQVGNPAVPGLRINVTVESAALFDPEAVDLTEVHTIPDPYYAQSLYDLSPVEKALRFVNLPPQATIRIYTVSGLLVDVINHNDPTGGGLTTWDLKNRSGQFVASGVYFFHVSTPDGNEHIGRFTVINSGIGQ